ncbi:MAG TPA: alpha/beta fold hydrolase [Acidimicrobiales bacterium]|nr:alpha/beta fold hydrolase [Acidimicrobiales bacterium]
MTAAILPGAEPFSASNGPNGVLVLHGFTGNPGSMRGLAEAYADAGFSVDMPLLPGHGTSVDDMASTAWQDWSSAAEAALESLAARCDRTLVAGLSMGGTLSLWLAARHPELAGVVVVNPLVEAPAESFIEMLQQTKVAGVDRIPGIGSDIKRPETAEGAYEAAPIDCMLSLFAAVAELTPRLAAIDTPLLLLSSREDHVVPPSNGDLLADRYGGPVERVFLENSYHVATLDNDADEIEDRAIAFAAKVTGD